MTSPARLPHLRRALFHPAWLAAIGTLALNDHLLKGSGWAPGWLTGKLSDVVGLFAAPLLLAVLLRVRSHRAWAACHVAIGLVFAGIQVSGPFADAWSSVMSLFGFPWVITRDLTDLLTLPALVLSYIVVPRLALSMQGPAHAAEVVVTGAGALACVATSAPPSEPFFSSFDADTYIHNGTSFDIVVRIRELRPTVTLDCDLIEEDPSAYLREPVFGDVASWTLASDANMPVIELWDRTPSGCYAAMIDADNLSPTIVFWRDGQLPVRWTDGLGIDENAPGWIDITFDDDGNGSYETQEDILFPVTDLPREPEGLCAPTDPGMQLAWSDVPSGDWRLANIDEGLDGCVFMELQTGLEAELEGEGRPFTVCLPAGAFPFADGDSIELRETSLSNGGTLLQLWGLNPQTSAYDEGSTVLALHRGGRIDDVFGMAAFATADPDCAPRAEETCGTVLQSASVSLNGGGYEGVSLRRSSTPTMARGDGQTIELYLVHAAVQHLVDTECEGTGTLGPDLEIVAVRRAEGGE